MPHAIIECSENLVESLRAARACEMAYKILNESGLFTPDAIKTRLHSPLESYVGQAGHAGKFIHITVYLMQGRTVEQRKALAVQLSDSFGSRFPSTHSLTVDVRELEKAVYTKK